MGPFLWEAGALRALANEWRQSTCSDRRLKRSGGTVRGDSVFANSTEGFGNVCDRTEPADVLLEMDEQSGFHRHGVGAEQSAVCLSYLRGLLR